MPSSSKDPLGILPHTAFVRRAGAAAMEHYQFNPSARVATRAAFARMQDHIEDYYRGVDVLHTFEDSAGQVFDCVPFDQQPGLRNASGALPTPPDLSRAPTMEGPGGGQRAAAPVPVSVDRHGNLRQAPPGTIPVRRLTLDEMTRFRDLDEFFCKYPVRPANGRPMPRPASGALPTAPVSDSGQNHRYSVGYQQAANIGGFSYLSIYQPTVDSNEVFSLGQQWYLAGSGTGLQSVEVGWQVFPGKYNNASPNLFIFFTPDGHAVGSHGSYNLDAANTFVQMNGSFTIGGALPWVSTRGGQQQCLMIGVYKWGDAWWIYLNGLTNDKLLGYYPTSLFGSGPMATQADTMEFGGETVSGTPPNGNWGPMGSGADASAGWPQSAFHCYIYYWPPGGGSQWSDLTQVGQSSCYGYYCDFDPNSWGRYLFFGGAGGTDC